jgi:hypothetical protein
VSEFVSRGTLGETIACREGGLSDEAVTEVPGEVPGQDGVTRGSQGSGDRGVNYRNAQHGVKCRPARSASRERILTVKSITVDHPLRRPSRGNYRRMRTGRQDPCLRFEGRRLRNVTRNGEGMAPTSAGSTWGGSGLQSATRSGAWRKVIDGAPRHAFGKPSNDRGESDVTSQDPSSPG